MQRREHQLRIIVNGILFDRLVWLVPPDEAELKAMDKKLEKAKGSAGLPPNADSLDRAKYALCGEFVKYCLAHHMSQRDIAARLDVSESRISEIVRYRIDKLTVDRLIKYLGKLNPKFKLNIAS